jgi:lipopolysaccharide/colanic/teichoic acid biosynthesis glycosyltransferase
VLIVSHVFLLPVWALLWMLIPLAIWLEDRGSIFYCQSRIGRWGRKFRLIKFRTMRQLQKDGESTILETENDPRVTRVGRFLRRTAIDELPQVLNIFVGHMSLVGPRPEPPDIHEQLLRQSPIAHLRLQVLPGLTGVAQLYGGYHGDLRNKLRYDLLYVKKMNLWLDVRLILLSCWKTLNIGWGSKVRKHESQLRNVSSN